MFYLHSVVNDQDPPDLVGPLRLAHDPRSNQVDKDQVRHAGTHGWTRAGHERKLVQPWISPLPPLVILKEHLGHVIN